MEIALFDRSESLLLLLCLSLPFTLIGGILLLLRQVIRPCIVVSCTCAFLKSLATFVYKLAIIKSLTNQLNRNI